MCSTTVTVLSDKNNGQARNMFTGLIVSLLVVLADGEWPGIYINVL